jgi:hypothetical protein
VQRCKIILASNQYQKEEYENVIKVMLDNLVQKKYTEHELINITELTTYHKLITAKKASEVTPEVIALANELDSICKHNNEKYYELERDFMGEKALSIIPIDIMKIISNYDKGFPTNNFWINKLYGIEGVSKEMFRNKYIKYKIKYIKLKNSRN